MASTFLYLGVNVQEDDGSPTLKLTRKDMTGQRVFIIDYTSTLNSTQAYADAQTLATAILPVNLVLNGQTLIQPSAVFPGYPWLVAISVAIKPFGNPYPGLGEVPARYLAYKVTVEYSTLPYDQTTFLSYSITQSGEFLKMKNTGYKWGLPQDLSLLTANPNGPWPDAQTRVVAEAKIQRIIPMMTHEITWHNCPNPPWAAIRACIGRVNAFTVTATATPCLPETLLFTGGTYTRDTNAYGTRPWTVKYKFIERNNSLNPVNAYGWNHYPRPDPGHGQAWERMYSRTGQTTSTLDYDNIGFWFLSQDIDFADTDITIANNTVFSNGADFGMQFGFPPPPTPFKALVLQIEDEFVKIITVTPRVMQPINDQFIGFSVQRGYNGTANVNHAFGAPVSVIRSLLIPDGIFYVASSKNFPSTGNFYVAIENEIIECQFNGVGYFCQTRAAFGTVSVNHLQGALVRTISVTTLGNNIGFTDTAFTVGSTISFPILLQFWIQIDNEVILVIGTQGNVFIVLRGMRGTVVAPHVAGTNIYGPGLIPQSGVFDLMDFAPLFIPGF